MNFRNNLALAVAATPNRRTYRVGELFSGAGGMTLGAHRAKLNGNGFFHVWVNDRDVDACRTLENNLPMPENSVMCGNVEDVDFRELQDIDGLAFGFPCNDFSALGERQGISGQHGGLYTWGVRALKVKQPSFFVAENVSGIKSSGGKRDFDIILSSLKNAGYLIFPHTYRFEDYGVPQARHRIIIVGFRKDLGIQSFEHPKPTHKSKPMTAQEALQAIPENVANNERTKQSETVIERLEHIKPGENAFTANLPKRLKLRLTSGATISLIYRRLKPDEPSYTVTGSGGGGTHVYHWEENRALTNRERARLQTFPDSFIFFGGKESVRKQIGMAVPPKGAEIIFRAVLKTLIEYNVPVFTP